MFMMIMLAAASFTAGVLLTALVAGWIIGIIHADAVRIVDNYGGVRLFSDEKRHRSVP